MSVVLISPELNAMLNRFVAESPSSEISMLVYDMIAISRRDGLVEAAGFVKQAAEQIDSRARMNADNPIGKLMEIQANGIRKIVSGIENIVEEHKKSAIMIAAIAARPR